MRVQKSISWMTLGSCLCLLTDSDEAARIPAYISTYRLLPATLLDSLGAVLCLPGAGSVALCLMIHKVLYLFGAKSVNCARNRTDCVCRASLMRRAEMLLLGVRRSSTSEHVQRKPQIFFSCLEHQLVKPTCIKLKTSSKC